MQKSNLIGQRFGKLVVIEAGPIKNGKTTWLCKCDCGKITQPIPCAKLTSGHTKSCGCLRTKHGMWRTKIYEIWRSMLKRCYKEYRPEYKNYGGRGITVCDEWRGDFNAFYQWAIANGYDENAKQGDCTLDRIDVNGPYSPENCRWVDMKTQQNNRRNNKLIEIDSINYTSAQLSEMTGLSRKQIDFRLSKGYVGSDFKELIKMI